MRQRPDLFAMIVYDVHDSSPCLEFVVQAHRFSTADPRARYLHQSAELRDKNFR